MDANSAAPARRKLESALSRLEERLSDFISTPAKHRLPSEQVVADATDALSALELEPAAKLVLAEAEALALAWATGIREKVPYRKLREQLVGRAQSLLMLVEGLRLDKVGITEKGDVIAACGGSRGWPKGTPCLSAAAGAATWAEATRTRRVNDEFSDGVGQPDPSQVCLEFHTSLDVLCQFLSQLRFTGLADRLGALLIATSGRWDEEQHARVQELIQGVRKASKDTCERGEADKLEAAANSAWDLSVKVGEIIRSRKSAKRRSDKATKRVEQYERDRPPPKATAGKVPVAPAAPAVTPLDQAAATGTPSPELTILGAPAGGGQAAGPPAQPLDYLTSWAEILNALKKPNEKSVQHKIRSLHDEHPSPIFFGGKGLQPRVEKSKLLEWWNGLEKRWEELAARERDKAATINEQHQYGRDGVVIPGIAGGKRRSRRKRPSTS